MNCQIVQNRIHDFLDLRLSAQEHGEIEQHLDSCAGCHQLNSELRAVRSLISVRHHLPRASQKRIQTYLKRRQTRWRFLLEDHWGRIHTFFRDLEPARFWSKVTAIPVTLCFFTALLLQLCPPVENLTFPVVFLQDWAVSQPSTVLVRNLEVRRKSAEINGLINAAWKIPYEDSLSLVAEITADGSAEIGDILEHPKSLDLLHAVDATLRNSRFDDAVGPSFVIVSFQKIDVHEMGF